MYYKFDDIMENINEWKKLRKFILVKELMNMSNIANLLLSIRFACSYKYENLFFIANLNNELRNNLFYRTTFIQNIIHTLLIKRIICYCILQNK